MNECELLVCIRRSYEYETYADVALLCDGHKLPLIPPHLEQFLYGETASLFSTTPSSRQEELSSSGGIGGVGMRHTATTTHPVTRNGFTNLGLSDLSIQAQRLAMMELDHRRQQQHQHRNIHTLQDLQHNQQ